MSTSYLDLKDRLQVVDFLYDMIPYLPAEGLIRHRAEVVVKEIEEGTKKHSRESLAELAKTVARAAWPARTAVRRYIESKEGASDEWRRIAAAVSNSTEHLLERFRAGTGLNASIEDVLGHEESPTAFRDVERIEIAEVRKHVLPAIWNEKGSAVLRESADAEKRLKDIESRISSLREIAFDKESGGSQDELVSKIADLEDRLYFAGEELDPKILDEEVLAYKRDVET